MTTFRYTTRVIVRIDSHVTGPANPTGELDLSPDVIRFQSNKQVKTRGRFQFELVPRRNYLNVIYPNDLINVYVDPGDGETGFTRVVLGYVDRISRTETTDSNTGAVTTRFVVICSDFQKSIDTTNIYFNPFLQKFIDKRFKNSLLGEGSTLRTNGVVGYGSPADFVENLILSLAGFGQQWVLPASYRGLVSANSRLLKVNRAKRRLPTKLIGDLMAGGLIEGLTGLDAYTKNLGNFVTAARAIIATPGNLGKKTTDALVAGMYAAGGKEIANRVNDSALSYYIYENSRSLLDGDLAEDAGMVDLMEFGFIEHLAIDGFTTATTVWQSQGLLSQIVYGRSNPAVNELMFDLRPVSRSDRLLADGDYARGEDETGINVNGYGDLKADVPGVKYVPAVIMREYPFSTVEGLDLSNYYVFKDGTPVGFIPFGPIFAKPTKHAHLKVERVVYDYRTVGGTRESSIPITAEACLFSEESLTAPIKHLDVCKIEDVDIVSMNVGRDDNDVVNLFAMYSTSGKTETWKYLLKDFSPILNPISIARNGLRVQEPKTEYGNYSRSPECLERGSAVDNAQIRRNLIRWQLLLDHWYQHNIEYLSGTLEARGMPWVRAGYRADFVDRCESYYVENVSHRWEYGSEFRTSLQLSRGQRNDPLPVYVPPAIPSRDVDVTPQNRDGLLKSQRLNIEGFERTGVEVLDGGDRSDAGRLSEYFRIKDTQGTLYATGTDPSARQEDDGNKTDRKDTKWSGRVEYPGDAASIPAPGRWGSVPEVSEDVDNYREKEARKSFAEETAKRRASLRTSKDKSAARLNRSKIFRREANDKLKGDD